MKEKIFHYAGYPLHYRVTGQGPVVLLVHGFGQDGHIWDRQVDYLQSHACLIIPDLPGSGSSPYAPDLSGSIEAMADCLWAMLMHETAGPVIILGHSLGGYIALAMMEKVPVNPITGHPVEVRGFGLVHSTAFADSPEKLATRQKAIAFIREFGSYAFLQTAIPGLFAPAYLEKHPEPVAALVEKGRSFLPEALVSYYEAMMARPDRTQVLLESQVPVLFMIGGQDKAAPMADVLKQVYLPELSLVTIREAIGHMGMLEDPESLNKALLNFLSHVG